jgi:hypothetical protein
MPTRFIRALAAASVLVACASQAAEFQPEAGIAYGAGSAYGDTADALLFQIGLGYRWDNGLGLRVTNFGAFDPFPNPDATHRWLQSFTGVELTDHLPLSGKWAADFGVGVGHTRYDVSEDSLLAATGTDGLVSLGIEYRFTKHYAMEVRVSYLTEAQVMNTALEFQIPF